MNYTPLESGRFFRLETTLMPVSSAIRMEGAAGARLHANY